MTLEIINMNISLIFSKGLGKIFGIFSYYIVVSFVTTFFRLSIDFCVCVSNLFEWDVNRESEKWHRCFISL